jgi:hypothetical protein
MNKMNALLLRQNENPLPGSQRQEEAWCQKDHLELGGATPSAKKSLVVTPSLYLFNEVRDCIVHAYVAFANRLAPKSLCVPITRMTQQCHSRATDCLSQ